MRETHTYTQNFGHRIVAKPKVKNVSNSFVRKKIANLDGIQIKRIQ